MVVVVTFSMRRRSTVERVESFAVKQRLGRFDAAGPGETIGVRSTPHAANGHHHLNAGRGLIVRTAALSSFPRLPSEVETLLFIM